MGETDIDVELKASKKQQIICIKWSNSYFSLLKERSKWREIVNNIACASMVLLKNENLPTLK